MRPPNDSTLIAALSVSIGVHMFGAAAAALVRPRTQLRPAAVAPASEIDFVLEETEPEETDEPREQDALQPMPEPLPEPEPPPQLAARVQPNDLDPEAGVASEPTTQAVDPTDPRTHPESSERPERPLSLDPRAVAMAQLEARPRVVEPQAQPDPNAEDSRTSGQRAAARLDGFLREEARRRPVVTRRGPPDLRRSRDGAYNYQGHAFAARIAPDGTVSFQDGRALAYDSAGGGTNLSVTTRFDLMDGAMRRRGEDPYAAERRWFLRQTQELRERLQDEARERDRTRAIARLRSRARRVWETTSRTPRARRGRIFRLWDQCTEGDPDGDGARRALVQWVRANLPAGSEDAYTPAELAAFNGRRESRARFSPY